MHDPLNRANGPVGAKSKRLSKRMPVWEKSNRIDLKAFLARPFTAPTFKN